MAIMHNEIFGPVVPIVPFDSFDEAIAIANSSRYGLSAYLFTNDMPTIMRAVNEIGFGEVYVNRVGPESLQGYHVGYRRERRGRRRRLARARRLPQQEDRLPQLFRRPDRAADALCLSQGA